MTFLLFPEINTHLKYCYLEVHKKLDNYWVLKYNKIIQILYAYLLTLSKFLRFIKSCQHLKLMKSLAPMEFLPFFSKKKLILYYIDHFFITLTNHCQHLTLMKSPGPNGIPPMFLKKSNFVLSRPVLKNMQFSPKCIKLY